MATNLPIGLTQPSLFASIDMGTNSFKLLIVHAKPSGKFLTIDSIKEPVILGRDSSSLISTQSQLRALESLVRFKQILQSRNIHPSHIHCVATAAVREAENSKEFSRIVYEKVGLEVDVLSGEEEARLVYLGVLQFLPVYDKLALTIDIGGGSTEFAIGTKGKVIFGTSLKLGHVNLTQKFVNNGGMSKMREYVRMVIKNSGLVEKVKECGFEVVVGSSGTIRAIEKAIFSGYARELVDFEATLGERKRDWRFSRGGLKGVVERLCGGEEGEKVRKDGFFKRRAEFIVAGAVLLEEIFELLGIEEMEVSGYALGEGVISEVLAKVFDDYDVSANARWHSVVRLATRFNGKKRIKSSEQCAAIAKEIFEGLRKYDELADNQVKLNVSLADKDHEYLEAACLLHTIGLSAGQKGYHKQSYHIIMNGDHLHGYSTEEVKFIALLTRHHRKKFPEVDHASLKEFRKEVRQKFRILCAIIRVSVLLQQNHCANYHDVEFSHSHEGFRLVFKEAQGQPCFSTIAEDNREELRQELERFKTVFQQELLVEVISGASNSSGGDGK